MQVGKYSVYAWAEILSNLGSLLGSNQTKKDELWLLVSDIDRQMYRPELTEEALVNRQSIALMIPHMSYRVTAYLAALGALSIYIFGIDSSIWKILFVTPVSVLMIGFYVNLRSLGITRDILRLRSHNRKGLPIEDFRLSSHAYIRWYDFAIPLALSIPVMIYFFG